MTIRLLRPFDGYQTNEVVTLDRATEAALVDSLAASRTLTGGAEFIPPPPYLQEAPVYANTINASLLSDNTAAQNNKILEDAIDSISYGVIVFPAGVFQLSLGRVIRKRIVFQGQGPGTTLVFVPETEGDTLFTWTGVNAALPQLTEEGQLNGPGVRSMVIRSDRTKRANGLKFVKADNVVIQNVTVAGFKGSGLVMQRSREWDIVNFRTRYNGYIDATNNANSQPDVLFASTEATGDSTNYTKNTNMFLIYAFGDLLRIEGCPDMDFSNIMLHQLPQANTALETNFVGLFPTYNGAVAAPGYGTAGVPLNEYAANHVSPGIVAASVSGRTWDTPMLSTIGLYAQDSDVRFSGGELVGGLTNYGLWADTGARFDLANFRVDSVSAQQRGSTSIYASTFTLGSSILTLTATCPETGTACQITNSGGALPTGVTRKVTYYIVKLSGTTCRLASSRANALAGTTLTVTGGSGTQTLTALAGYNILATGGATVQMGHFGGVRINDGYQPMFSDIASIIYGSPRAGVTYANGFAAPQLGAQQILFVAKDVDFTLTTDQSFTRVCSCSRYYVTGVVAKGLGGTAAVGTAGGIYTAAAKGGSTIVAAAQSWVGLSTINKIQIATLDTYATTDAATATPVFALTTGSGTACRADVYIYGYPID